MLADRLCLVCVKMCGLSRSESDQLAPSAATTAGVEAATAGGGGCSVVAVADDASCDGGTDVEGIVALGDESAVYDAAAAMAVSDAPDAITEEDVEEEEDDV